MNENIDLTKILKNCPKGWEFYSSVFGDVKFESIDDCKFSRPIIVKICDNNYTERLSTYGKLYANYNGECIIFPSREQRDWSKFTAPWYKKEKFDPRTLKPFDKVVVRDEFDDFWRCEFFNYKNYDNIDYPYVGFTESYKCCIPYNDDTKHLVGTTDEAPEYYKYWET